MEESVLSSLSESNDPSVRFLYQKDVLGIDLLDPKILEVQNEIRSSEKVQNMLAGTIRNEVGKPPRHAYSKWKGAFWVLLLLVEQGYPPGDMSLIPLRNQVLAWLLDNERLRKIPLIAGKYRRCACQEGTALLTMIKLGISDSRIEQLADLLKKWQWPDGGWNCDKKPAATHSSFYETWLPLRAMNAYAEVTGDQNAKESVDRASEVFLSRHLFKQLKDGNLMSDYFTKLAYPAYWHYDILVGLLTMKEIGRLNDPRCSDALDWLESRRLLNGGFPADIKYYKVTDREISGVSVVDWGPTGKTRINEYVTVRALSVLKAAGRLMQESTS